MFVTFASGINIGLIYGTNNFFPLFPQWNYATAYFISPPPPPPPHLLPGGDGTLLLWQIIAVLTCSAWAGVFTFIIFKITAKFTPIRASDHGEMRGLDLDCHGEMYVHFISSNLFHPFSVLRCLRSMRLLPVVSVELKPHHKCCISLTTRDHRAIISDNSEQLCDLEKPLISAANAIHEQEH